MAYFPETIFLPEILPFIQASVAKLPEFGLAIGKNELTVSEVADENWATALKNIKYPVRVTRYLTIVSQVGKNTKRTIQMKKLLL